jgi:hypothetical protein
MEPALKADVLGLPYGWGSGFVNPVVHGNGYVFCARIGSSAKPWFRYVPADDEWSLRYTEDGTPVVSSDTLISLRFADPQDATAERWLPEDVYDKAFDAWEVARDSVYASWKELTDPNAFQPDLPLSFRDAYSPALRKGAYLGRDALSPTSATACPATCWATTRCGRSNRRPPQRRRRSAVRGRWRGPCTSRSATSRQRVRHAARGRPARPRLGSGSRRPALLHLEVDLGAWSVARPVPGGSLE